jgi:hypothetical protein
VIAFYTSAVNALTGAGSSSYVGGFVFVRDLFTPAQGCATSNVGEIFYMLAPDPTGAINTNVRTQSFVKSNTVGTLAHEFQHLINGSRRIAINVSTSFEEVWLNEGLSHIAEELVYYGKSGRAPLQNLGAAHILASQPQLDAYNLYMSNNYGRLVTWWQGPETSGPFAPNDDLNTRGAIWWFLRYAADRKGGTQSTFWNALAGTTQTGTTNLTNRLGENVMPWFRDWAAISYTDDVGGTNAGQSWNWRDIRANAYGGPYQLFVRAPTAGVTLNTVLGLNGSASYVAFRVPASTTSDVTITTPSSSVPVMLFRRN